MYEYIKPCIFIILYFQIVASYRIYQLDSAEGIKLLPKIRQLLLNQRYHGLDKNLNIRHAKREHPALKPMGKSVLVKRKIPHGYTTGDYEYDSKLNTVYKPLIRYHVKKPIEEHEISVLKSIESNQPQKDKGLIVLLKKDDAQPDFLKQIEKYINKNARQQKYKKGRFRGLNFFKTERESPSVTLREKSGEDNDPFAPGKLPPELLPPVPSSGESMEKVVYPIYPFYNHWTYEKNIMQDRCPVGLIKVGNMCISSIGHRRYADASKTRRSTPKKKQHSIRASRKKHLYGKKK